MILSPLGVTLGICRAINFSWLFLFKTIHFKERYEGSFCNNDLQIVSRDIYDLVDFYLLDDNTYSTKHIEFYNCRRCKELLKIREVMEL